MYGFVIVVFFYKKKNSEVRVIVWLGFGGIKRDWGVLRCVGESSWGGKAYGPTYQEGSLLFVWFCMDLYTKKI